MKYSTSTGAVVGLYGGHTKKICVSSTSITPSGYYASAHKKYLVMTSARENWFRASY
jgi:hypothetical protein